MNNTIPSNSLGNPGRQEIGDKAGKEAVDMRWDAEGSETPEKGVKQRSGMVISVYQEDSLE